MASPISEIDLANRVLSMLSRANRCIVRAESPDGLYHDLCRIAVECGLFRFAWIGLLDPQNGRLRGMASHGTSWCVQAELVAPGSVADRVWNAGSISVYNDLLTLPPAAQSASMIHCGIRSIAGLPLREESKPIGVMLLYSDLSECFTDAVVSILREVADDIGYALSHMLNDQRRLAVESKLYYMALYDPRTGLPNRTLLDERLPQLARRAERLAVLAIQLRRLEQVSEIFGRLAIDEVLRVLAQRLEAFQGYAGLLAQLAPDEFALVSPDGANADSVAATAAKLLHILEAPVRIEGREIFLHPAIGAALYPEQERDVMLLLRRARVAAAFSDAEGGFRMYSAEMDSGLEQRVTMEAELHRALEREEFELFYQPQLNLEDGAVVGVEALLRWRHPQHGLVMPGQFLPLLEECGLMVSVGEWVTRRACLQAQTWQAAGLPPLRVSVNVSASQFGRSDFVAMVASALRDAALEPRLLELELTENLILENVEQTIAAMHQLNAIGVCLALDDFGTGYSSLSYLRRYPIQRLKIDRSFVHDMSHHANSEALVRSILAMAGNLGLHTIAEGVETVEQRTWLERNGCEEMQGYLFSRPVPSDEIVRLLESGVPAGAPGTTTNKDAG